jgi:hypothetical protein
MRDPVPPRCLQPASLGPVLSQHQSPYEKTLREIRAFSLRSMSYCLIDSAASHSQRFSVATFATAEQVKEARRLLSTIRMGTDPYSGDPIREEEMVCVPEVRDALDIAIAALRAAPHIPLDSTLFSTRPPPRLPRVKTKSWEKQTQVPVRTRAGSAWLPNEDTRLSFEFGQRISLNEIARSHGRSSGAIVSRLVLLGVVKEHSDVRRLLR